MCERKRERECVCVCVFVGVKRGVWENGIPLIAGSVVLRVVEWYSVSLAISDSYARYSGRGKTAPPAWCIGPRVVSMSTYSYT